MSEIITLPSSSCIATVTMNLSRVVARTTSPFTLETQSFRWPGEQWSINFTLPPIVSRAIASDWISFAAKMKGSYNYFLLGDPSARLPRGSAGGTPLVSVGGTTGNIVPSKGWPVNANGVLLKGDYIQLGTDLNAHLHMVVEDINSDATGLASISIEPALREATTLNQAIITTNARGLFRLQENSYSWNVTPGPRYSLSFDAIEVINA